jgi:hypothetical protein
VSDVDADVILRLAHAQGQTWVDLATAARIATGAAAAARAVDATMATSGTGLVDDDPSAFLAALESLANPP